VPLLQRQVRPFKVAVRRLKRAVSLFEVPMPHPKLPMHPFERSIPLFQLSVLSLKLPVPHLQRENSLLTTYWSESTISS